MPSLAERFPEHCKTIIELCFRDEAVRELCHDYDEVVKELEEASARSNAAPGGILDDLYRLKRELETELLSRLNSVVEHQ